MNQLPQTVPECHDYIERLLTLLEDAHKRARFLSEIELRYVAIKDIISNPLKTENV